MASPGKRKVIKKKKHYDTLSSYSDHEMCGIVLYQNNADIGNQNVDSTVDLYVYGTSRPPYNNGDGSATLYEAVYYWPIQVMVTTTMPGYRWVVKIPKGTMTNFGPNFTLYVTRNYPIQVQTAVEFIAV